MLILNGQEGEPIMYSLTINFFNCCRKRGQFTNGLFNADLKQTNLAKEYNVVRVVSGS
jgi:hypothetical protein